jgi:hypothetical protein
MPAAQGEGAILLLDDARRESERFNRLNAAIAATTRSPAGSTTGTGDLAGGTRDEVPVVGDGCRSSLMEGGGSCGARAVQSIECGICANGRRVRLGSSATWPR